MSYRIYWDNYGKPLFNMLGSIWFANLDCLVNNVQYMCDDDYEYQQPSESYKSDKSDKPKLGLVTVNHVKYYDDIGYRTSTTLNGSVSKLEHDLINIKLNDSINEYSELYAKLK